MSARVVIVVAALVAAGVFVGHTATHNPDRPALEAQIRELDARLVVLRALAADPARVEADHAATTERRAVVDGHFVPPLEVFAAELAPLRATVERTATTTVGACRRETLRFVAPDRVALAALVERLEAPRPMLRIGTFEVDATGAASLTALACARIARPPAAAPTPADRPRSSRWYGVLNADLSRAIERKQAELAALERQHPRAIEKQVLDREVGADLAELTALERAQRGIRGLGAALFLGQAPLLASGRVEAKTELVVVRGRPTTAAAERSAYAQAVGPQYDVIRFRAGPELEMTLQPVE